MSKIFSEYICQQCSYRSPSFLGKCPECGEWNSLVETVVSTENTKLKTQNLNIENSLVKLAEVKSQQIGRIPTGFGEFNRVLGGSAPSSRGETGGIVPGSIVLISGDPGIGKSTLLLQSAVKIAEVKGKSQREKSNLNKGEKPSTLHPDFGSRHSVLYVSGEESPQQVKIRGDRIGKIPSNLFIFPETDVDAIILASQKVNPTLLIIDSIQTLTSSKLSGSAGGVGQLRECSQILQRYAKSSHVPIFIVGHVTKEGAIAGPKVLEHLVDTVLNLEGDDMYAFRILRSSKNRFGSTFEVGVFEMHDIGLVEVSNPSQIFLSQRIKNRSGSVVCPTFAGGRPLLSEVQALTTATMFGIPARKVTGLDFSRMQIVIAALSKALKLSLGNLDIYLNVAGGLKVTEPAVDLAAAVSIASAVMSKPLRERTCVFGEVGLLGELRPVGNVKNRISEAKRLGFSDFVTPDKFRTLEEAVKYALGN